MRIIEANETKDDRNGHYKVLNHYRYSGDNQDWCGNMSAMIYSNFWVTEIVKASPKQISVADQGFFF